MKNVYVCEKCGIQFDGDNAYSECSEHENTHQNLNYFPDWSNKLNEHSTFTPDGRVPSMINIGTTDNNYTDGVRVTDIHIYTYKLVRENTELSKQYTETARVEQIESDRAQAVQDAKKAEMISFLTEHGQDVKPNAYFYTVRDQYDAYMKIGTDPVVKTEE